MWYQAALGRLGLSLPAICLGLLTVGCGDKASRSEVNRNPVAKPAPRPPDLEPIYPVPASDEEMRAAMKHARETFSEFLREVEADSRRAIPALETILVKAYFADSDAPDDGEHMWLKQAQMEGKVVKGRLVSTPGHVKCVRSGEIVRFPLERLSDWLYVVNGKAHGAFTVKLLRSRMSAKERKEHDSHYPFTFD
jgi:uncharacterized protein YegJ (DUF2314 family)